jgi:hypothetical protein
MNLTLKSTQLTYNETQDFHVFCDASEIGFGGHLTTGSEDEPGEIYFSIKLAQNL